MTRRLFLATSAALQLPIRRTSNRLDIYSSIYTNKIQIDVVMSFDLLNFHGVTSLVILWRYSEKPRYRFNVTITIT